MTCNNCDNIVSETDNFCSACGVEAPQALFSSGEIQRNRDVKLLLLYCSWVVFVSIAFAVINRFLLRKMIGEGLSSVGEFMVTFNLVIAGIDVLLIFLVLFFAKSKMVKTVFSMILVIKIFLLVSNGMKL